jgi:aldehyde dehydrogenase (NAD+)
MQPYQVQLYIGGEWRPAHDQATFDVLNPATRERMAQAARGTPEDAKAAVDAAEAAFPQWAATPAPQRAEILFRVGEMIREQRDELGRMLTLEEGKALREAVAEIDEGYDITMFIASEGRRLWSHVTTSEQPQKFAMVVRRPLGVAAAITPWNFPFAIPLWKIPPALVAGNTVVFKPASLTPIIASKIVEMFVKAGLPKGVLNLVTGPGGTLGEALVGDARVRIVDFTGESATGKRIAEINARYLRRQVLELGGKNPMVVGRDAPMDVVVDAALYQAFSNAGQKCTQASRIIVEEAMVDQFTQHFVAKTARLVVGNGLKPGVEMGPVVSQAQLDKVRRYVQIGLEDGAKLFTGGQDYADDERKRGFFYPPTVFGRATNDMRIAQDEIFGPVTAIIPARNFEAAIEIANDTRYGLSSAVYTRDIQRAFEGIMGIDAGIGYVNQGPTAAEVHLPFGGVKDSGFGREAGEEAIEHYTEKKSIFIDYSYARRPWYFPWS